VLTWGLRLPRLEIRVLTGPSPADGLSPDPGQLRLENEAPPRSAIDNRMAANERADE
jgi:hypothetical protein